MPAQLPEEVVTLLKRLAIRGWKSRNDAYVTEIAQQLCATYGIQQVTEGGGTADNTLLERNTAALIEWLNAHNVQSLSNQLLDGSKILKALLGDMPENRAQNHYNTLLRAKAAENDWKRMIDKIKTGGRALSTYDMVFAKSILPPTDPDPESSALAWFEEQLQRAKDVTYALARQAVAENLLEAGR